MSSDAQPPGRVSDDAVRRATGRGWQDWLAALDEAGAAGWDHARLVAHLGPEVESGWWQQAIAVRYEQERGGRVVGQTQDSGFQVGVRRTLDAGPDRVWELLVTRPELWLGDGVVSWEQGAPYEVTTALGEVQGAVRGQVRVVQPGDRLRLTWHPEGWAAPAALQLRLLPAASGRTALAVHLERLADADARALAREHWHGVLDRLSAALAQAS